MRKHIVEPGQQFSYWTIIKDLPLSRNKARKFLCKCICGNEKEVFYSHLVRKNSRSCGCRNPRKEERYNWTGCGDLTGDHWNQIVRSASGRKGRPSIPLSITIQDAWELFETQKGKCALTDLEIKLGKRGESTASLDRIDSNKGYELCNIQWVHKDVNRMKNIFSQKRFIEIATLVTAKHGDM